MQIIKHNFFEDDRGDFMKTYRADDLKDMAALSPIQETFISKSKPGVLRGMHYQKPPFNHVKLVTVITGKILDVAVCVDQNSKNYGKVCSAVLSNSVPQSALIDDGYAHGFLVLGNEVATVLYHVTTAHNPEHDCGVAWNSIGFDWQAEKLILSARDLQHPALGQHDW